MAALGEGVTTFDVGERVLALSPGGGSFAERVVVPAEWTAPLPTACEFVTAATLPVAGVTRGRHPPPGQSPRRRPGPGHRGRRRRRRIHPLQLALQARATVTGQAGGEERAAAVRATGAEALVHPEDGSVDGEFDVVLDGIGGPMVESPAGRHRPQRPGGHLRQLRRRPSTFRVEAFYKGITILGFRVFTSVPPTQAVKDMASLADQAAAGALEVKVQATAPSPTPSP